MNRWSTCFVQRIASIVLIIFSIILDSCRNRFLRWNACRSTGTFPCSNLGKILNFYGFSSALLMNTIVICSCIEIGNDFDSLRIHGIQLGSLLVARRQKTVPTSNAKAISIWWKALFLRNISIIHVLLDILKNGGIEAQPTVIFVLN